MNLDSLERSFQDWLLRGGDAIRAEIEGRDDADIERRLLIYFEGYRLRLIEALAANFPVLARLLGEADFERLALAYLAAHPSRQPSLRWFGDALPEMLAEDARWTGQPFLAELARFEWAMDAAFDAQDVQPLDADTLKAIPLARWPELRLRFHPSVQRLDFRWNTPPAWKSLSHGEDDEARREGRASNTTTQLSKGPDAHDLATGVRPDITQTADPTAWLVWRQGLTPYFRSLEVDEAFALDTALAGGTFATICEGMTEWIDGFQVPARAAGLIRHWVDDRIVTKILT